MKKKTWKAVGAAASAAMLVSGYAPIAVQEAEHETPETDGLTTADAQSYDTIANVKGTFTYHQDQITPADEVFNLFGSVTTGICAKPGFALEAMEREDHYINIGGSVKKCASYSLADLEKMNAETRNMVCSCGTGSALAQARVTGVPLSQLLPLSELEEGVNAITMKSADGYAVSMPLEYVLEKEAMLVYAIGDQRIPSAQGSVQIWMPDTVAKYFTRQVTELELSVRDDAPAVKTADDDWRVKVSLVNRMAKDTFAVGDLIIFEGYADDCGIAIEALEFSMDGGATWTECKTDGAASDRWVCWSFAFEAEQAGTFKLDVRARNAEGLITPLSSSMVFTVTE